MERQVNLDGNTYSVTEISVTEIPYTVPRIWWMQKDGASFAMVQLLDMRLRFTGPGPSGEPIDEELPARVFQLALG